jgi:hypothetical protein
MIATGNLLITSSYTTSRITLNREASTILTSSLTPLKKTGMIEQLIMKSAMQKILAMARFAGATFYG